MCCADDDSANLFYCLPDCWVDGVHHNEFWESKSGDSILSFPVSNFLVTEEK